MSIFDDIDILIEDNMEYELNKPYIFNDILETKKELDNILSSNCPYHMLCAISYFSEAINDFCKNFKLMATHSAVNIPSITFNTDKGYTYIYEKIFKIFNLLNLLDIQVNINEFKIRYYFSYDYITKNTNNKHQVKLNDELNNRSLKFDNVYINKVRIWNMIIDNFNFMSEHVINFEFNNCCINNCKNLMLNKLSDLHFYETPLPNNFRYLNQTFNSINVHIPFQSYNMFSFITNMKNIILYHLGNLSNINEDEFKVNNINVIMPKNEVFYNDISKIINTCVHEILAKQQYSYNFKKKLYKLFKSNYS